MSKRFVFNQQHGDRKKAKLDITISDHNFPLSQNSNNKEDQDQDNWGDDNDDEILLLASQACEQAYNEVSSLPDYSMCMQPGSTSTQYEPSPSTSKTAFTFKKPSPNPPTAISTHLKNKCSTISSPLPGMSAKVQGKLNEQMSNNDDLVFNDKVCKGQDPDYMYRQLLKLQEDNTKLKSENGKLLEKCVTKEGEASILRTQLKSCQVAVDNARMDKIKAQERVETEWNEKLSSANSLMNDLRTQLDFKNLEIISIKEKCKKLESSKLKLTQVTLGNNDILSSSHRNSYSNDTTYQARRVRMTTSAVQTDNKANFLKLNNILREDTSKLTGILPLILESTVLQHRSILDYNEKLQKHTDYSQNKCRIFSTFHRIPSTPNPGKDAVKARINLSHIYEDLTVIATEKEITETVQERYFSLFSAIKVVLQDLQCELEAILQRVTNAFQKEMDERYIEASSSFLTVNRRDLLQNGSLYRDEQAIFARRIIAVATYILESPKSFEIFKLFEEQSNKNKCCSIIDYIKNICNLLDSTSCAVLYSGLLLSITVLLENFLRNSPDSNAQVLEVTKIVLSSRPMPFVSCYMLVLIRRMATLENCMQTYCPGSNSANLKVDYDQGVLLYKKDSCYFQVLIKQVEASLKCVETQSATDEALNITRHLIAIHSNFNSGIAALANQQTKKCDCQLMLVQVIVYSLRICAVILKKLTGAGNNSYTEVLLALCRSGVRMLYQCSLRDLEFSSQLAHNEGHLIDLCEIVREFEHNEIFGNMLSELTSTFQASPEETSSSFHRQPWLKSFESFSLTD